jgi:hypothetical protein
MGGGRRKRVNQAGRRPEEPGRQLGAPIGEFASHIIFGAAMCAVLLLVSAALSALLQLLPFLSSEPEFLLFARVIHLFLLWSDGFLFVWWVLYSIWMRVREWR